MAENKLRKCCTLSKFNYTILLRDERRESEPGFDIAVANREIIKRSYRGVGMVDCMCATAVLEAF